MTVKAAGSGGTREGEGESEHGRARRGSCARSSWRRVMRDSFKRDKCTGTWSLR